MFVKCKYIYYPNQKKCLCKATILEFTQTRHKLVDIECDWWRLFQKSVVITTLDMYIFIQRVKWKTNNTTLSDEFKNPIETKYRNISKIDTQHNRFFTFNEMVQSCNYCFPRASKTCQSAPITAWTSMRSLVAKNGRVIILNL